MNKRTRLSLARNRMPLIALGSTLFACLACTAVLADELTQDPPARTLSLDDIRTFSDVYNAIRRNYVDPVSEPDLLDSALRGMVEELDIHSRYLSPEEMQRQDDNASGQYGGIGITLDIRRQRLVVDSVVDDGPARRGGVKPGDVILEVENQPVKGRPLQDSMNALLGPPGSTVTVQFRTRQLPPRDVELTRAYIPVPSVEGTLIDDNIALIRLISFNMRTADEVQESLMRILNESGGKLNGVILDVRDNPGGLVQAATLVADGFLESGLVFYTKGRYSPSQMEYFAEPGEWIPAVPLAILVNGVSASASEILAGALQDHGRALVIGSETYGKGTVQAVLKLRNGSGLKLTTARYYTAAGRSFDQTGITPDVVLEEPVFDPETPAEDEIVQRAVALILDGSAPREAQALAAAVP